MKRCILCICVFLLLGAIVNIAVAWGIAAFAEGATFAIGTGQDRELPAEAGRAYWLRHAPSEWHDAEIGDGSAIEWWAPGRAGVFAITEDLTPRPARLVAASHDDTGWPLLALRCRHRAIVQNGGETSESRWGWQVDVRWFKNQTLPLLPIWPGFAINTVLYAAILCLLFVAPFALRRRSRIKRGLCPKCAYDLRGTPHHATACPECGARMWGGSMSDMASRNRLAGPVLGAVFAGPPAVRHLRGARGRGVDAGLLRPPAGPLTTATVHPPYSLDFRHAVARHFGDHS